MSGRPAARTTADMTLPSRRFHVNQGMIDAFAEVSGDVNPLHVDPHFAVTTEFGGTIAHGFLTLALLCNAVDGWLGPDWAIGADLDAKFVAPVRAGSEVAVAGTASMNGPQLHCALQVREAKLGDRADRLAVAAAITIPAVSNAVTAALARLQATEGCAP